MNALGFNFWQRIIKNQVRRVFEVLDTGKKLDNPVKVLALDIQAFFAMEGIFNHRRAKTFLDTAIKFLSRDFPQCEVVIKESFRLSAVRSLIIIVSKTNPEGVKDVKTFNVTPQGRVSENII